MELKFYDIYNVINNYKFINKEEFMGALDELENLIGLEKTKKLILGQIAYGLMLIDKKDINRNKYMMHTLITGPPGVGKTKLAKILGRLWCAMGLLTPINRNDKEEQLDEKQNKLVENLAEIVTKIDVIKSIIPGDVLNMEEEDNENDKPVLWRLDYIKDKCKESEEILVDKREYLEPKFTKATRADLIGKYQGHTAVLTRKVLNDALGGVLFVDEAYQLMTSHDGHGDNFGSECLTIINEFMSEHPDKIIVIFGGYNDTMNETIFRVQPGLRRRFIWHFNIESYTPCELSQITIKQFKDELWNLTPEITIDWLSSIISNNLQHFKSFGGDTQRLVFYSIIEHSIQRVLNDKLEVGVITPNMITSALSKFHKPCKCDTCPENMYL